MVPGEARPFKRALLAYDGSPKTQEALFIATYLASAWKIPLVVGSILDEGRVGTQTIQRAREYLEARGWSEAAIEMYGLLANQEAVMNSSFLEVFREDSGNFYTNMVEIEGGTDRLPHSFLPELAQNIRFGAKMIAVKIGENSRTMTRPIMSAMKIWAPICSATTCPSQ